MKKFVLAGIIVIIILFGILMWKDRQKPINGNNNQVFTVALDWTPNTNHTGIYVALEKGWYAKQGIDVKILPYSASTTPDLLVATGKADVGISATEGVLEDAATGEPVVSIAAIIAHDQYGLIANADEGIESPKDLDGKIYGGFGAPYETPDISQVIKNAGGKGIFKNVTLSIDAMQALESKKIDFAWVSAGWELISEKSKGMHVVFFPMSQYGVPDYYTPVIITSPMEITTKKAQLQKFMTATAQGYAYAQSHPKEAATLLIEGAPKGSFPDTGLVYASQDFLSSKYADPEKKWGVQVQSFWYNYPEFLLKAGAILDQNNKPVKTIDYKTLYTNQFLQ